MPWALSPRSVEVAYVVAENHHYGFELGEYDEQQELIIDPLLDSTYLGGHNPTPPGNYDDDQCSIRIPPRVRRGVPPANTTAPFAVGL